MERLDGPLIEGNRLSKRLIDYLQRRDVLLTTTVTLAQTIETTVNNAGNSGDALLAAMYGTNGIQVLGSIESGVEIRGPTVSNGFVPTYIAAADTFTVPENYQALYHFPIQIDGVLLIDGALAEV